MLQCQKDSFLVEFTTKLVESMKDKFTVNVAPGVSEEVEGVGLVFEDTVFFPEGGGQPCDRGVVKVVSGDLNVELTVSYVFRKDGKVIHLVEENWDHSLMDVPAGTAVHQSICWPRRQYHMLHHSGQHLITALANKLFEMNTLSWCLGPNYCYLELDAVKISDVQLKMLEFEVASYIHNAAPVVVHVYDINHPNLQQVRTRGLPDYHSGDVRVVEITDLEANMCCGTHVSHLGQLEAIKFLKVEKKVFKKRKSCLLYFVAGADRVFQKFQELLDHEGRISSELNEIPEKHHEKIVILKKSLSDALKKITMLEEEIVMKEIDAFKAVHPVQSLFSLHRPTMDTGLMNFAVRQFKDMSNVTLFLTFGGSEEGLMLLMGAENLVTELGPKICSMLAGKGKATGNRYQARIHSLSERERAEHLLKCALNQSAEPE